MIKSILWFQVVLSQSAYHDHGEWEGESGYAAEEGCGADERQRPWIYPLPEHGGRDSSMDIHQDPAYHTTVQGAYKSG